MPVNSTLYDLSASTNVNLYNGFDLPGLIAILALAFLFVLLLNLKFFRRFMKAGGYLGKAGLHILEGGVVYLCGKSIYDLVKYTGKNDLITWDIILTWGKWGLGFLILGFISHWIALRLYDNYVTVREAE